LARACNGVRKQFKVRTVTNEALKTKTCRRLGKAAWDDRTALHLEFSLSVMLHWNHQETRLVNGAPLSILIYERKNTGRELKLLLTVNIRFRGSVHCLESDKWACFSSKNHSHSCSCNSTKLNPRHPTNQQAIIMEINEFRGKPKTKKEKQNKTCIPTQPQLELDAEL
jgi:hypothetical protein